MNFIKKVISFAFSRETILYVVFGLLTTLVNLVVFKFFDVLLGSSMYLLSNSFAWIISVIFAYVTNKSFVFEKNDWKVSTIKKEFIGFTSSRVTTYFVEQAGLWFFVDMLLFSEKVFDFYIFQLSGTITAKLILGVLVVILNWVFSKFLVFKSK